MMQEEFKRLVPIVESQSALKTIATKDYAAMKKYLNIDTPIDSTELVSRYAREVLK